MRKFGLVILAVLMMCPLTLHAQSGFVSSRMEKAIEAGEIAAMNAVEAAIPFSVYEQDGQIYGVTEKLFQRRMKLGDAALFARVGVEEPAAGWTWTDFLTLAEAVRAYRTHNGTQTVLLREELEVPLFVEALLCGAQAEPDTVETMLAAYRQLCGEGLIRRVGDAADGEEALLISGEMDYLTFAQGRVIAAPADFGGPVSLVARMRVQKSGEAIESVELPEPQMSGAMAPETTLETVKAHWNVDNINPPTQAELTLWLDGLARGVLDQQDDERQEKCDAFRQFMEGAVSARECARRLCGK